MEILCCIKSLSAHSQKNIRHSLNSSQLPHRCLSQTSDLLQELDKIDRSRVIVITDLSTLADLYQARGSIASYHTIALISRKLTRMGKRADSQPYADVYVGESENGIDVPELMHAIHNLANQSSFGLGHYIDSRFITTETICSTEDKDRLLNRVNGFLTSLDEGVKQGVLSCLAGGIRTALDELILNAVFHGHPGLHIALANKQFTLNRNEQIVVDWGYDGRYFGFAVIDPFGALRKDATISKLIGARKRPALDVQGEPSLGVGLKLTYETLDKMIVNVRPGKKTEIIGLLNLLSPTWGSSHPGSLHFFEGNVKADNIMPQ